MSWRSTLRAFIPLAAVACLVAMAPTGGTDAGPDTAAETSVGSSEYAPRAALRAYLDPETGRLGTRPAQASPLSLDPGTREALRRDSEGLVEVHHPDGSISMHLQGRFQSATVVRIGDDGKVMICSENVEDVNRALAESTIDEATGRTPEVK
jgi:hypothetical protein